MMITKMKRVPNNQLGAKLGGAKDTDLRNRKRNQVKIGMRGLSQNYLNERGDRSFKGKSSLRCKQISGFTCCLLAALSRAGFHCNHQKLFHHLEDGLKGVKDDQLAKVFKTELAYFFSRGMKQELPEGHIDGFRLFPRIVLNWIQKSIFLKGFPKRVKFLWNLLQCKDLAEPVPKSMILKAYEKHRDILSSVGESPKYVLDAMRPYFREFFSGCKFTNKTRLPPQTAYYNSTRQNGGCLKFLEKEGIIKPNIYYDRKSSDRIEPVVIHLTGVTGVGKSFLSKTIALELSKRFGFKFSDCYDKPIGCDFWDGYSNQLVVTIDDAFSKIDDGNELTGLLQICSPIKTVLPMAKLNQKGTCFTSPFLIITSNHTAGIGMCSIRNREAIFRRLNPSIEILRRSGRTYTYAYKTVTSTGETLGPTLSTDFSKLVEKIVGDALASFETKDQGTLRQEIITSSLKREQGLSLRFPLQPPETNFVKACAIPEPLKVRMITKSQELSWALKPIQVSLWERLGDFKCFSLTHGPEIDLSFVESFLKKGKVLVSGDYESATDNLHMDVMALAIEILCEYAPQEYHDWLRWEAFSHDIEYPAWTCLKTIRQTRGQLMGSLLSFPILCIANAAILGIVKKQELSELEGLINGDDILFADFPSKVKSWKKNTKLIGLKPSIGKNYISNRFGSINSQLLCVGEGGNVEWCATGGFKGAYNEKYLMNIRHALRVDSPEATVCRFKRILKATPQSIDIPWQWGGLGNEWRKTPEPIDKRIYMFLLNEKHTSTLYEGKEFSYVRIPSHLMKKYGNVLGLSTRAFVEIPDEKSITELVPFDFKKFRRFNKTIDRTPLLRARLASMDLEREIPLDLLKSETVRVNNMDKSVLENLRIRL